MVILLAAFWISTFVPAIRFSHIITRHVFCAALAAAIATAASARAQDGFDPNGQCVGDADSNGQVTVNEIIIAVNNVLNGCQFVPVTLQFRAMVGTQPFACGDLYNGIGTTGSQIVPSDFRFYIHNVRVVTAAGNEVPLRLDQDGTDGTWQYGNLALLDFENKVGPCREEGNTPTNATVRGKAPPGTYTGVRFLLGVPFELDHLNELTAPLPLRVPSLFWGWQDGYRFLKVDLLDVGTTTRVFVHVGSMGCQMGPGGVVTGCTHPNVGAVSLDNFDPSSNVIVADLAALLSDSDITANQIHTPPGCESNLDDMDCVPLFKNLGINFGDGSPSPSSQKFFRVE